MKSSFTNISAQFFPTYIGLNQQVTVSHKYISTIFPTYIGLNQQVTVSHKYISTIFPTYIRLNQQVSHKYINTLFPDLYTIKSASNCLSKVFPQEVTQ